MKIEDMILVTLNNKGQEINSLCTFDDYLEKFVDMEKSISKEALLEVIELEHTRGTDNWADKYFTANISCSAKYCSGQSELRLFLKGIFNEPQKAIFDAESSSRECIEELALLGISLRGELEAGHHLRYEKVEREFRAGEILHNLNGVNYRVLEKLSDRNLLLMDVLHGNMVVACGTDYFARYPKNLGRESEHTEYGIEWGCGEYLDNDFSKIDFAKIREKFGEKRDERVKDGGTREYDIQITETLQRVEHIEAECLGDAIDKAMELYYGEEIVLDAEDMKGVDFDQYKDEVVEQGKKR